MRAIGKPGNDDDWLRFIAQNSSEIVVVVDPDGTFRYASPAFGRIMGYDPGEAPGKNLFDLAHPDDVPRVLEETERVASGGGAPGGPAAVEYRFRHEDGSWRWAEGTFQRLLGDPEVRGLVATVSDVTGRTEAEEALRESEEKYRTLVENVGGHAIFMLDADGYVTEWTRGAERVKGYSAEEVVGRHLCQFPTPEQIEAGEPDRELAEAAETGRAEREAGGLPAAHAGPQRHRRDRHGRDGGRALLGGGPLLRRRGLEHRGHLERGPARDRRPDGGVDAGGDVVRLSRPEGCRSAG
jgi:PAS domain S-box-containing protein